MTIIIVGNSHVAALQQGADQIEGVGQVLKIAPFGDGAREYEPFSAVVNGQVVFTVEFSAQILLKLTGKNSFDPSCTWGICMGTHNTRVYSLQFWQTAAPSIIAGPRSRPVSNAVLEEIFAKEQIFRKVFLSQLLETGVKFLIVSAPSPRRDGSAAIRGVPLATIEKLDRMARDHFRKWIGERNIPIVEPPEETMDEQGFLLDEFAQKTSVFGGPDPHHANSAYGKIMVQKILDSAKGFEATWRANDALSRQ
jgi:hypothetical protein